MQLQPPVAGVLLPALPFGWLPWPWLAALEPAEALGEFDAGGAGFDGAGAGPDCFGDAGAGACGADEAGAEVKTPPT